MIKDIAQSEESSFSEFIYAFVNFTPVIYTIFILGDYGNTWEV